MTVNVSPFGPKPQFELASGAPAVGNKLFFYVAGSVNTKQNTFTDSTGLVANTNPIVLNSLGEPSTEIWFTNGVAYKVVYAPATDTDPPTSPIWTIDNLTGQGNSSATASQWVAANMTPTYINSSSFSVVGDQTDSLQVGRRLRLLVAAGTVYAVVKSSAFSLGVTTVTLFMLESGALDSGLSSFDFSLLQASPSALPADVMMVNVLDCGAICDGVADDTSAWNAAVAKAAAAAGGGVITAPAGRSSKTTAQILVQNSNVQFYLPNFKFAPSGASSFSVIKFDSGGGLATPVLGTNAAAQATSISVSTLGGLVAGSWLGMKKAAPDNGGAADDYVFITKVRSVSGAGPWTITLNDPLPVAFNTADTGLALSRLSMLENVGVRGKVTIDASGWTGATQIGVEARYCVNSVFDGIHGYEINNGAAAYAWWGYGNTWDNLTGEQCGNASYNAVMLIGQNASTLNDHRSMHASGFGLGYHSLVYCTGSGFIADGCNTGRGVKFQASLSNALSNIVANWNTGANGVAVAIGSCNNTFSNIVANGNPTNEGLWLSDQFNLNNTFYGVQARGNTTRDVFVGDTDTGNMFFGVRTSVAPYIGGTNATTLWFGLNGEFLSGGNSANNPLLFLSNLSSGVGATPWIGVSAGDFWINNITGKNITFSINNVACGYATVNGLQSAAGLRQNEAAALVRSLTALTDGTGAGAGTLTNAPSAGNPTKWIPIIDNGTTRWIPTWT